MNVKINLCVCLQIKSAGKNTGINHSHTVLMQEMV